MQSWITPEDRHRSLFDEHPDAAYEFDLEGRFRAGNPALERLLGRSVAELVGLPVREFLVPEDLPHVEAMFEQAAEGQTVTFTARLVSSGNRVRSARITHVPLVVDGTVVGVHGIARDRGSRDREEGGPTHAHSDVTEGSHVQRQLQQKQRMESLSRLAGGMAHDLNNALGPVLLGTQLLAADEDEPDRLDLIEMIEEAARHGADLVRQVLCFARGIEGRRVLVDVEHLIEDVDRAIRDTFPPTIRCHHEVAQDPWALVGDAAQLHQALMNLCANARDAMPDGGELTLRVDNVVVRELPPGAPRGASTGPHVRIHVTDTGTGMSVEVLDHAFEPFYTTKEQGQGSGLGLSTSLGIVESHQGLLQVESRPGEGTTVVLHLPASPDRATGPSAPTASARRGNGERVLLVEDHSGVRDSTARTLRANGYEVLVAPDGETAVQVFDEHAETIDVVLSDLMMPGLDGIETLRRMRERRDDVPGIIASGLVEQARQAAGALEAVFLPKAYDTRAVLDAVTSALARRRDPLGP